MTVKVKIIRPGPDPLPDWVIAQRVARLMDAFWTATQPGNSDYEWRRRELVTKLDAVYKLGDRP